VSCGEIASLRSQCQIPGVSPLPLAAAWQGSS